MAHWAELNLNNQVVNVLVGSNNEPDEGYQWIINNIGGNWIKTSYTSRGGNRIDPNTGEVLKVGDHLRYNFAGIGFTYDEERDAFIPPKTFDSWTLNEDTCLWEAPVPYPNDGNRYEWNEENLSWEEVTNSN